MIWSDDTGGTKSYIMWNHDDGAAWDVKRQ